MVGADSEEIFGLTAQTIHCRKPAPKKENTSQRLKRDRESEVWGKVIDATGRATPRVCNSSTCWIAERTISRSTATRGSRAGWVVRASQLERKIVVPCGKTMRLKEYLPQLPAAGSYQLYLRAPRTSLLAGRSWRCVPGRCRYPFPRKEPLCARALSGTGGDVGGFGPRGGRSPGVEPIEWVLYTSEAASSFEDACRVVGYYEKRWLIEEWHKALKTGCRVTDRQLKTKARLEAMVGLMSLEAVRLVQLKAAARTEPNRPAEDFVPLAWVMVLMAIRKLRPEGKLTVGEFYREMAKLGGFIGRKSDGEPGWIAIWRGWGKLYTLVRGSELATQFQNTRKKCG